MDQNAQSRENTLETTLGELILALTEETTRLVRDEKEACKIVAIMLVDILNGSGPPPKSWH